MFTNLLLNWFDENERCLPWRQTKDPYLIWVSEIILQQTRVVQGFDYYLRFVDRFPDLITLAAASEDEVLKYWQGLGYYSRARNLLSAAKSIKGDFPKDYKEVLSLKGVGDYTAAAICSFAYDLPYAVVDGNVYRVLSRYFGLATPIDTAIGKREFAELAQDLLDLSDPARYNQAIMDFGALQCKPKSPDCFACPLVESCIAFNEDSVAEYPVKRAKIKSRDRYFNYFFIEQGDFTYLRKRVANDIWKNLYEIPLIESEKEATLKQVILANKRHPLFTTADNLEFKLEIEGMKHVLSHQNLYANFYSVTVNDDFKMDSSYIKVEISDLTDYAIPRLIDLLLERYL